MFSVVSFRLYERLGAFGCGDECINYAAGYFINSGKTLYSQIFFNHQPTLAYVSAVIQRMMHPADIYHLVLYHRLFVTAYALIMGILLLWRFRLPAVLFLLLYEGTKVYLYGYQFIGEALLIYPLVYLIGLLFTTNMQRTDLAAAAVFSALVFWLREPYAPLALVLYLMLLWRVRNPYVRIRYAMLIAVFILFPFAVLPVDAYVFQVVTVNIPASTVSVFRSLLYPVSVYVFGKWSYLRWVEIGTVTMFWTALLFWWLQYRNGRFVGVLLLVLMLAAIRTVEPGTMYFEAFHMLSWYAVCIAISVFLLAGLRDGKARRWLLVVFTVFTFWAGVSPQSFTWEHIDREGEFASQYAKYTQYAQAIRIISEPDNTLFLDMWDDVIYWEAQRPSSYPLSLYIPVEAGIPRYQALRSAMFTDTPPDVYYSCPILESSQNRLPESVRPTYTQLLSMGKPGCLYIQTSMMRGISDIQRQELGRLGITLP